MVKRRPTTSYPPSSAKWSAAFGKLDADALAVALFEQRVLLRLEPDALSRPGRRGRLFQRPAALAFADASEFTDVSDAQQVERRPDQLCRHGEFLLDDDAAPLSVKITWVIVREDGDWKIVSHHVSSRAPLIER